ncbi:MAG: methyltransferase, TrmH family [Thermosediminibacterales bacterium]|nr:methyltransferase, TrmH family [Thermosediminibacterales bacterium]MDK2835468.1 methyltransferase, TrmH family [Thermosediminibacterales bacterium]
MVKLRSKKNHIVKLINSLSIKKYRYRKGLFVVEGFRIVSEALNSDFIINSVVVSSTFAQNNSSFLRLLLNHDILVYEIEDGLFSKISDTVNPQGILAIVKMKNYDIKEIIQKSNKKFLVMLDSIQDPGNLGTVIRSCHACNVDGVIVTKGSADVFNPKTLRSTMGSIFHIPIVFSDNPKHLILELKRNNIKIVAAILEGEKYLFQMNFCDSILIILGNEANGISNELLPYIDYTVKIPMPGNAESLNVAVAGGIFLYEVIRQRMECENL